MDLISCDFWWIWFLVIDHLVSYCSIWAIAAKDHLFNRIWIIREPHALWRLVKFWQGRHPLIIGTEASDKGCQTAWVSAWRCLMHCDNSIERACKDGSLQWHAFEIDKCVYLSRLYAWAQLYWSNIMSRWWKWSIFMNCLWRQFIHSVANQSFVISQADFQNLKPSSSSLPAPLSSSFFRCCIAVVVILSGCILSSLNRSWAGHFQAKKTHRSSIAHQWSLYRVTIILWYSEEGFAMLQDLRTMTFQQGMPIQTCVTHPATSLWTEGATSHSERIWPSSNSPTRRPH